ncbi:glycosyltransferase family 4 protein [Campylobacter coli]|uniref:glycosyltransferase family 4 protein n=1 Tax=Campylobacter coli TaxID=195 RepID=UPI000763E93D|nr:glycosyltransferase family 4 protein [Campylobacter coli]EAH9328557.1 glycosyltransferase family 4 protein [Campylobacter coli]MCE4870860.1 glycosyltransferase family 4 protein [Campylobacter coli]MCE7089348.1 glycosyltransferase family 4 protein [Campylobacter coli]MCE7094367.1 glycosyltransferase family 4 protein [Campylobacter coli]MCE7099544.1 glycosyltransferase family 4 protein [Campylobacter coli]
MKILLLIGDITLGGGAERVVCNLANGFNALGHDVEILSFYKDGEKSLYEIHKNIKISFFYKTPRKQVFKKPFHRLYYKHYESYILKQKYKDIDVMIYNNCSQFPFFKNKNTKYIKLIHEIFKRYQLRNNFFDNLIILSLHELSIWKQYHNNVSYIPNFTPTITNKTPTLNQKIILSIGRITKEDQKGFLRLVDIWEIVQKNQSFKEWKLHIVGDGALKEELFCKIKTKKLEHSIVLLPFNKNIEEEYLKASIYVMTSYFESFGMVLIESANYSIPSISFDVKTGPKEIIDNKRSGFLIEDGNLQEFANKLQILMQDEDLRKKFGKNAKEKVRKEFSKEVIMKKWIKLINS